MLFGLCRLCVCDVGGYVGGSACMGFEVVVLFPLCVYVVDFEIRIYVGYVGVFKLRLLCSWCLCWWLCVHYM